MKRKNWIYVVVVAVLCAAVLFIVLMPGRDMQNVMAPGKKVKYVKKESLPVPKHIVIVMEENHSDQEIIGNSKAPYMNKLAKMGMNFTNMHAITHPSQPNYIALFSGSTQGVTSDSCPHSFNAPNMAEELTKAGKSFAGYSEDLPTVGFKGCSSGLYYRKHSPWVNFTNLPASVNKPFSMFPSDYSKLPTVSFVIPNLNNDMHNGTIEEADKWLKTNIDPYIKWANKNNSLFILTWDEDDHSSTENKIPTIFAGQMVKSGKTDQKYNLYSILRTIEDMYGLPALKNSQYEAPVLGIWKP
ncbi:alkaline phosphatase family protein [Heyndrickxia acidicola]|uniref:Alkaline phosphatase family protein n=1 Tax=Heyndrickxia acidicola TaxID=209389 RepID=A0ABU6MKW7_9BACI|nr:alkaline phosphatase family protein [Heyndrickxia acidicola]MED1204606.1 alkaline phosphatase family protein [Heyndrickxia acidicola]